MPRFIIPLDQTITFWKQPSLTYCWHTQIKTFLHAFANYQDTHNVRHFSPDMLSKITGYMFPKGITKILQKHWIHSAIETCPFTDNDNVVTHLKTLLKQYQKPVILLIGHGYTNRSLKSNLLRQMLRQHYISVRWYDHEGFFAYDSALSDHDESLPIGNLYLPNSHLLKYRKRSYIGFKRYLYIRVVESE